MDNRRTLSFHVSLALGLLVMAGCGQESAPSSGERANSTAAVDGSKYLLAAEPDGALDVIKAREASQDTDDVVIVGRIGGSEIPWVDGRAAFTIVDVSLKSCTEVGSDGCAKPWDFC